MPSPRKKVKLKKVTKKEFRKNIRSARKTSSPSEDLEREFGNSHRYKKTPQAISKALEAFRQGATYRQAAKIIGVSRGCLLKWRMEDPELDKMIEAAKMSRVKVVEDALFNNAAIHNNTEAQKFYLKNRAGKKWKEKQEHQHTGDISLLYGYRKPRKGKEE